MCQADQVRSWSDFMAYKLRRIRKLFQCLQSTLFTSQAQAVILAQANCNLFQFCRVRSKEINSEIAMSIYRVVQKSKPLPNYK